MRLLVVALTMCAVGCASDTGPGRGSSACHDWQAAICDYAADRCAAMTRAMCDSQYQAVTCKSDKQASSCADQFNDANCGRASASCDIDAVADPAPAAKACDQLVHDFCARSVACGVSATQDDCLATPVVTGIDCTKAVAYRLGYEACLQQVQALDCTVLQLPQICSDVIIVRT